MWVYQAKELAFIVEGVNIQIFLAILVSNLYYLPHLKELTPCVNFINTLIEQDIHQNIKPHVLQTLCTHHLHGN
jgi:hypothetical protein